MAKNKLSAVGYKAALKKVGKHGDGDGLVLTVTKGATGNLRASWILIFQRAGKRTELGLGSASADESGKGLSLAQARAERDRMHDLLKAGIDPKAERERLKQEAAQAALMAAGVPTVRVAMQAVYDKDQAHWRSEKYRADWLRSFGQIGALADRKVDEVTPAEVASALKALWASKPVTADRTRGRLEMAFDWAIAGGWRSSANPASKSLMKNLLPKLPRKDKHHRALEIAECPSLIAALRERQATGSVPAFAVEFCILNANRAGEVCGARWAEIDMKAALWTIPPSRMKAAKEHMIPLAPRSVEILFQMQAIKRNDFVFPASRGSLGVTDDSLRHTLIATGWWERTTLHGLRSTFRDWAGDHTHHPREVAEAALAHTVGSAVETAYRRASALEKRRALMLEWAAFLDGKGEAGGKIIAFKAPASA